eukprot:9219398-Karenia_brevis.AAC.1
MHLLIVRPPPIERPPPIVPSPHHHWHLHQKLITVSQEGALHWPAKLSQGVVCKLHEVEGSPGEGLQQKSPDSLTKNTSC